MVVKILTCSYPPELGTTPKYIEDLAVGLAAAGHEVEVFTPPARRYFLAKGTSPVESRAAKGLRVRRIRLPFPRKASLLGRLWEWSIGSLVVPLLARFSGRADHVLVVSPPLPLAFLTALLFHRRSVVITNIQDLYPKTAVDVGILRRPWLIRFFERVESYVYRRSRYVVVDTVKNERHVSARGAKDVRIVQSWATLDDPVPEDLKGTFRAAHGWRGKFLVSYGGMFSPHQGLDVVVRAAERLREDPSFHFVLAGDGMAKEGLVEMAREKGLPNVTFLPYIPPAEYRKMVSDSDASLVCLAPTVATAVPGKIYSIMGLERPVIACVPLEGNVPPVIERSGGGVCLPPGDAEGLANAIRELAKDPGRARAIGQAGRKYVTEVATLDAALAAYREMMAERKRS